MYNPFDGVTPSLGPFGQYLNPVIVIGLGLLMALGLAYAAAHLVPASLSWIRARRSGRPHQAEEALKDMAAPGVAIVVIVLIPVIYLVLVNIAA